MSKGKSPSDWPYLCLLVGIAAVLVAITGEMLGPKGDLRFTVVSDEARWILAPIGIIMIALSVPLIRKQKFPIPKYTDEEAEQAKAKLDQMYLREHGSPPEPPKSEEGNPVATETKKTT